MARSCQIRKSYVVGEMLHVSMPGKPRAFRVIPTPIDMFRAFTEMLGVLAIECPPQLIVVADAEGYGGLWLADHNAIVVGVADVDRIARTMLETSWRDPRFMWVRAHGHDFAAMRSAAMKHLIAHELGHAIDRCGANEHRPACEGRADAIAGEVAETLQWCMGLGQLFMHAIGCDSAPACTHPSRTDRVEYYVDGRSRRRSRRLAAGWR